MPHIDSVDLPDVFSPTIGPGVTATDVLALPQNGHAENRATREFSSDFGGILRATLKAYAKQIRATTKETSGLDQQVLESATDDIKDLSLKAESALNDFAGTFFEYIVKALDSRRTTEAEINNFLEHAKVLQVEAERTIQKFIKAHGHVMDSLSLWPMERSEKEKFLKRREHIISLLDSSTFPDGLLKTYMVLLPAHSDQLYMDLEGDTRLVVERKGNSGDFANVSPLSMILNVWAMFRRDIQAVESARQDGNQALHANLDSKVYMLRQLYSILPDALSEFRSALTAPRKRQSNTRTSRRVPWWKSMLFPCLYFRSTMER
ncbi:hypothetical protein SCHPADRAFT_904180 [Schizopora paradoxa]|uniref:Uncharacterized protein n=1 Tax=Schizopora paradoxa TaxID=27342 RepID=A0A0H2RNL8_9AGAM|nr:hypothetical protein SCHPADRAFT_904180 [Schizopora paradoxa]